MTTLSRNIAPHLPFEGIKNYTFPELSIIRNKVQTIANILKGINNNLADLIKKSTLSNSLRLEFSWVSGPVDTPNFEITVPSTTVGYTVYCFRKNVLGKNFFEGADYDGNLKFSILLTELKQWSSYLRTTKEWHTVFFSLMISIFGKKTRQVTKTASKSVKEILSADKLPISENIRSIMKLSDQEMPVLLLDQVGLDFTQHPHRDSFKKSFETMYANANNPDGTKGLKAFNKKEKTFVIGTYTSILSVSNIAAIFEQLMIESLLALKTRSLAENRFLTARTLNFTESDFIKNFISQTLIDAFKAEVINSLTLRSTNPNHTVTIASAATNIEEDFKTIFENKFNVRLVAFPDPDQSITDDQKRSLLCNNTRQIRTKLFPVGAQDANFLLKKVLECEAYQNLKETLGWRNDSTLQNFFVNFKHKLPDGSDPYMNTQYSLKEEGAQLIFSAFCKIFFQKNSKVSDQSVQKFFEYLITIDDSEAAENCGTGFKGRAATATEKLVAEGEDPILNAYKNLVHTKAAQAFHNLSEMNFSNPESAMFVAKLPNFMKLVKLLPNVKTSLAG